MPEEAMWDRFFDPSNVLKRLGLAPQTSSAVDFGCGYGTFTIPAARLIAGTVHGFDIEPEMIKTTGSKAESAAITNIQLHLRDFIAEGTGLPEASVDYVMLFNILHAEDPERLLHEAHRILAPGGTAAVMHWVSDRPTPRGPSLDIRPSPADCQKWLAAAGFVVEGSVVDLPPYHFGLVARKAWTDRASEDQHPVAFEGPGGQFGHRRALRHPARARRVLRLWCPLAGSAPANDRDVRGVH
jgi:SAM-dependent methyltransferase